MVWQFIENARHSIASRSYKIASKYGVADNGAISQSSQRDYHLDEKTFGPGFTLHAQWDPPTYKCLLPLNTPVYQPCNEVTSFYSTAVT